MQKFGRRYNVFPEFFEIIFLLVLIDWKGFFNAQFVHFFLINPVWKFDGIFSPPR